MDTPTYLIVRDLTAHPHYVTQSCAVRQPVMHSHTKVGAWSPKQESHVRANKATHEAYELWHKSHRWASSPFKDRFVPTISCLVYALHYTLLKLTRFKLVGYFVATSGRQRICNSNLLSFFSVRWALFCLILFFSLVSGTWIQGLNNSEHFTVKYHLIIYLCN